MSSREQLAVAKFAQCLQVIPKTLAINAAQDAVDLVSKVFWYFLYCFIKRLRWRIGSVNSNDRKIDFLRNSNDETPAYFCFYILVVIFILFR